MFVGENGLKVEAHYPPVIEVHIYLRAADEAVLPCRRPSSSSSCSAVYWFYKRNEDMKDQVEAERGIIDQKSPRSARLSLDHNCSLIISNITAEDAGRYSCQNRSGGLYDREMYLNIMSISPSPPDADPVNDGTVTLSCSLMRYRTGSCPIRSLFWVNKTGTELLGEGVELKDGEQTGCVSHLTVKLQSSSRFSCRFVEGKTVKIEAQYGSEGVMSSPISLWSPLSVIMLTLKITGLILIVGITAGIIRTRGSKKQQEDINVRYAAGDDTVSYENDGEPSAAALS